MLSRTELTLLQYLKEHSGVSGGRIGLDPRAVMRTLGISKTQLAEDAASLAGHGFAGVRYARPGADGARSSSCSAIWITTGGEAHLKRSPSRRAVTANPGR